MRLSEANSVTQGVTASVFFNCLSCTQGFLHVIAIVRDIIQVLLGSYIHRVY